MKKIFTSILFAMAISVGANATNYYVDGSKADDSGNGQSWATAKKTITAASALGVAGDNIFVKAGTYSYSQATSGSSCLATTVEKNYYGGFAGTETSTSDRAISDLDGNGIVEPWEFSNPTILSLTASNNAYGLYFNTNTFLRYFDGFTITGSSTGISITGTATTYANSFIKLNNNINFQNNIVNGVTFSEAMSTSGSFGGSVQGGIIGVLGQAGTINNCLIEKNIATITATGTQYDNSISPIIFINSAGTTGRNVCSNTVIRNNQVSLDCSGVTSMTYNNQRGMILALTPGANSTYANAVKNVIIHNNTALFTPKTGSAANTNLGNGGLLYVYNPGTSGYKDSIINCIVANNKMTRIGYGIKVGFSSAATQYTHIVANNVGYQNINYGDVETTNAVQNFTCWTTGTNVANLIANNIGNGGVSITLATGVTVNNLSDLATANTGAKAPYFCNPTTSIGANRVAGSPDSIKIAQSRWMIGSGSYLLGKGITTLNKTDKAGHSFVATPSVGAYEYASNVISVNINEPATSTSSVTGAGTYDYGSSVTLTATPYNGKLFSNWTDVSGTLSSNSSYTFVTTKDNTITANIIVDPTTVVENVPEFLPVTVKGQDLIINISGQLEVYNSVGRLVISTKVNDTAIRLNQSGVYLIKVKTQKGLHLQKVII